MNERINAYLGRLRADLEQARFKLDTELSNVQRKETIDLLSGSNLQDAANDFNKALQSYITAARELKRPESDDDYFGFRITKAAE